MRISVLRHPTDGRGEPHAETFDLPEMKGASISHALQYINRHIDGSLAYYLTCRRGVCVGCVVKVNGENTTACMVEVQDGMVIEPLRRDLLIKDTVVDLSMVRGHEFDLAAGPDDGSAR